MLIEIGLFAYIYKNKCACIFINVVSVPCFSKNIRLSSLHKISGSATDLNPKTLLLVAAAIKVRPGLPRRAGHGNLLDMRASDAAAAGEQA